MVPYFSWYPALAENMKQNKIFPKSFENISIVSSSTQGVNPIIFLTNDFISVLTESYARPNEQKGGKGPVTNIDFFSRKSSLPTGSICPVLSSVKSIQYSLYDPLHEKTKNLGFQPGPTQTGLCSHRSRLICAFVFAYACRLLFL